LRSVSAVCFFLLIASVSGLAPPKERTVIYERSGAPRSWILQERAPDTEFVVFNIALKQRNLDVLFAKVWEVSDPKNEEYGKHWTRDEVLSLVSPPERERAVVFEWIRSESPSALDIVDVKDMVDAIRVVANVRYVEKLFNTKMMRYKHKTGDIRTRHMGEYSIPSEVNQYIDMVTGIADFPPVEVPKRIREKKLSGPGAGCNIPYTMKILYNVSQDLVVTNKGVSQAPFSQISAAKEGFGTADLDKFDQLNSIPTQTVECILGPAAGEYKNVSDDTEATLDIQMITSFGIGATTCFWIETSWMYEFALDIINTPNAPLVNSISYGWPEIASCQESVVHSQCKSLDIPNATAYVQRTESEWAKIALLGHTVVASSGDTGAPGPTNDDCTLTNHPLNPLFPSTSAFITSVGATTLVPGKGNQNKDSNTDLPPVCEKPECPCSTDMFEIPCTIETAGFTTGGGFSDVIPQPQYQQSAVSKYLQNTTTVKPSTQYWNSSNRAIPDIAGIGNNVLIVQNGAMELVGGTSASCPLMAGLFSQLNNLRLNQGRSPLGLMNPLLYQIAAEVPEAFHDITVGGIACTESSCCKGMGYHATPGWDPVGGLGTPNFGLIYDYVANLPR